LGTPPNSRVFKLIQGYSRLFKAKPPKKRMCGNEAVGVGTWQPVFPWCLEIGIWSFPEGFSLILAKKHGGREVAS
jgi:hypothetical protein